MIAGNVSVSGDTDGAIGTSRLKLYPNIVLNGTDVIIIDTGNDAILVLNSTFHLVTLTGGYGYQDGNLTTAKFFRPSGGVFDLDKNFLVTDTGNNVIRKISPLGNVTLTFPSPKGIIVDPCGKIILISKYDGSGSITLIQPYGESRLLAGTGANDVGYIDGPSQSAEFDLIFDLVQDSDGNFYIPDKDNCAIRSIILFENLPSWTCNLVTITRIFLKTTNTNLNEKCLLAFENVPWQLAFRQPFA